MVKRSLRLLQQHRAVPDHLRRAVLHGRQERREERRELHNVRRALRARLRGSLVHDKDPRNDERGKRNRGHLHDGSAHDLVLHTVRPHPGSSGMGRPGRWIHGSGIEGIYSPVIFLRSWLTSGIQKTITCQSLKCSAKTGVSKITPQVWLTCDKPIMVDTLVYILHRGVYLTPECLQRICRLYPGLASHYSQPCLCKYMYVLKKKPRKINKQQQ